MTEERRATWAEEADVPGSLAVRERLEAVVALREQVEQVGPVGALREQGAPVAPVVALRELPEPVVALREQVDRLLDQVEAADRVMAQAAALRAALVHQLELVASAAAVARREARGVLAPRAMAGRDLARRSLRAELAAVLRLPETTVERLLANAGSLLGEQTATFEALSRGLITERHATLLVEQLAAVPETSRPEVERAALSAAPSMTPSRFDRHLRALCEAAHAESLTVRRRRAEERRGVWVGPARDGMAWLEALLPAHVAAAAHDRLTRVAQHLGRGEREAAERGERGAAERGERGAAERGAAEASGETGVGSTSAAASDGRRTRDQLRADVLADLLIDGDTAGMSRRQRGIRAEVTVLVPALTLLGGDTPATLDGVVPIDAETARELCGGATSMTRILTHPETGAMLSIGRERYRPSEELRRVVRLRDGTCRFVGCAMPARRCEIDHTADWHAQRGATDLPNLMSLCTGHHTLKHASDWRVSQARDGTGTATWTSPGGREYRTEPAVLVPSINDRASGNPAVFVPGVTVRAPGNTAVVVPEAADRAPANAAVLVPGVADRVPANAAVMVPGVTERTPGRGAAAPPPF